MRAVLQRVSQASVEVDQHCIGKVGHGWLILLGIAQSDDQKDIEYLVTKILNLRSFSDADGKLNLSVMDVKAEMLVVSQFTLLGDCRKGRRPSFTDSAPPEKALLLYEKFLSELRMRSQLKVACGQFQAHMKVNLVNDGPVTLLLDSAKVF